MDLIVKMFFGSMVYGTALPTSDQDVKTVYIPKAEEILLGRIKNSIVTQTKKDKQAKNTSEDIDTEYYAYHYFLKLLSSGQTVALDMLFTPEDFYLESSQEWKTIIDNKEKFVSKSLYPFIGYCKSQAIKYSIKGTRIKEAKQALEIIQKQFDKSRNAPVEDSMDSFLKLINTSKYVRLETITQKTGCKENYLVVCEKKIPFKSSNAFALKVLKSLVDQYGLRTLETEGNMYDQKAMYNAFRVAYEALELLVTGQITFPRPEADFLLQVRKGLFDYNYLQTKLDNLIIEIDNAMIKTQLRETPDLGFIDQLVVKTYRDKIVS